MILRKALIFTAAILAAVLVYLAATLPPGAVEIAAPPPDPLWDRTVSGAYHVHSTISDGAASRERIASAAASAGLAFVIFTEHGDGTRRPEPPRYLDGVLCLDGVEISTNGGHYVALDMRESPFPLGGEAAAVVDDVRRLGGFGIVAHPESAKEALGWTDWTLPIDAIEWLNADSEWRDEPRTRLLRIPFDYLVRPGPALASLLGRPAAALERWDTLAAGRPVVGLAGHDAHGGVAGRIEGRQRLGFVGLPSYEASFRSFATRVILRTPLTGDARRDARLLLESIRTGRVFTAIDAIAAPAWLDFRALHPETETLMGQTHPFEDRLTLHGRAALPPGGRMVLLCNGREVAESPSEEVTGPVAGPGACRVEVRHERPGRSAVPWLVSNPIYLHTAVGEPVGVAPLFDAVLPLEHADWMVEKDRTSEGIAVPTGNGFGLKYVLGGSSRASQYVGAAAALRPPLPAFDRILFTAGSSAPMRVSVQLRFNNRGGERWTQSVYVSPDPRRVSITVADLVAAGPAAPVPDARYADALLFVVDLTNARPGQEGTVLISDISLARAIPGG